MPYIKEFDRFKLGHSGDCDANRPQTSGELNYIITLHCHDFIKDKGLCYDTLNTVIGVLESAKLELYRQVVAPYEDKKKLENGSVSELDDNSEERMR